MGGFFSSLFRRCRKPVLTFRVLQGSPNVVTDVSLPPLASLPSRLHPRRMKTGRERHFRLSASRECLSPHDSISGRRLALQVSFAGMAVCAAVLILGYCCRGTLIVGLLASLAFGSTALVTLSSLGGSSPLIFTVFAALLVLSLTARRRIWHDLGHVFGKARPIWVLFCLLIYTVAGAWFLPRLFAGKTTAFTQSALYRGIVVETPLAPVSGNISQTAYFLAGGLAAIALCTMLVHGDRLAQVRRGFFVWCILHSGLGVLDLGGKLAGAGDVLLPIRTASYAMLTQSTAAGFWRIAGPYSEASAFGAASLACLAFTYTYWRKTGSWPAKHLSIILLALLLLSTSSTAYVGLAVISVPVAFSMFLSFVSGRFPRHDILLVSAFSLGLLAVLALALQREGFFDALWQFIDSMILNKVDSDSGASEDLLEREKPADRL